LVLILVGCSGGTGATSDGGAAGHGGAIEIGKGTGGAGGAPGTGGAAGVGAGGAAGVGVDAGGAAGVGVGAGGAGGTGVGGAVSAGGAGGTATGGAVSAGGAGGTATGGAVSAGGAGGTATGGVPGTGGRAGGGVGGMNCRPDVLIVQDKSGSMSNDDSDLSCNGGCGANSKWAQLTAAVTNVLQMTDSKVNWGLKYFPDNNACDAVNPPAVPVAAMNGSAVATSIAANAPGGDTPTRDAITYGMMYLQSLTDTNPKFLLLATDGLPNCPAGCASMAHPSNACTQTDNPSEDLAAEAAVMMAASQGINTFVIGIGNVSSAQNTLNQLALAGGEPQPGAATDYFAATDEAAFELALNRIVNTIAGCPH
jgi:hypothetical protein